MKNEKEINDEYLNHLSFKNDKLSEMLKRRNKISNKILATLFGNRYENLVIESYFEAAFRQIDIIHMYGRLDKQQFERFYELIGSIEEMDYEYSKEGCNE